MPSLQRSFAHSKQGLSGGTSWKHCPCGHEAPPSGACGLVGSADTGPENPTRATANKQASNTAIDFLCASITPFKVLMVPSSSCVSSKPCSRAQSSRCLQQYTRGV